MAAVGGGQMIGVIGEGDVPVVANANGNHAVAGNRNLDGAILNLQTVLGAVPVVGAGDVQARCIVGLSGEVPAGRNFFRTDTQDTGREQNSHHCQGEECRKESLCGLCFHCIILLL